MPNRRHRKPTLGEFLREANQKHQEHLNYIMCRQADPEDDNMTDDFDKKLEKDREEYRAYLNEKFGKNVPRIDYLMTDSMHNKCERAHNYSTLNQTTIYCTQCGDVQHVGGVVECAAQFTKDQLLLISRALNFYGQHPEYLPEDSVDDSDDASQLASLIYKENFMI